jgi:hypothetical protein
MNTITIAEKITSAKTIKVPYFAKLDGGYYCCTGRDKHGYITGMSCRDGLISKFISESDLCSAKPCSPAEFAAAFEEAHHNLRAEYEAIIEAQEGGK